MLYLYFASADRAPVLKVLSKLKIYRLSVKESDLKARGINLQKHLLNYYTKYDFPKLKLMIFKEDGSVEVNRKKIAVLKYPSLETPKAQRLVVTNIPNLKDGGKARAFRAWLKSLLNDLKPQGTQVHLANQYSAKLFDSGVDSLDVDIRFKVTKGSLCLPDGRFFDLSKKRRLKSSRMALARVWARNFKVSFKKILEGDKEEMIRFNVLSLKLMAEEGLKAPRPDPDDMTKEMRINLPSKGELPESIQGIAEAVKKEDVKGVMAALADVIQEEAVRYFQLRTIEKGRRGIDSEVTRIASNIISRTLDMVKAQRPDVAPSVTQYFIDNRKVLISALAKDLTDAGKETRTQATGILERIRQERD